MLLLLVGLGGTAEVIRRTAWAADSSAVSYARDIRPVLESHCFKCHGPTRPKGGIDFSAINDDRSVLRARKIWRKAIVQLGSQEMPPAHARPLSVEQRERLMEELKQIVQTANASSVSNRDPGPALVRRLSLAEYDNTIRDLLGVVFNAAEEVGMPDESSDGNHFGNLATVLDVAPALMDKYFAAADKILDRFLGTELSSQVDGNVQERARLAREKLFMLKSGTWRNPRQVIKPPEGMSEREAARKIVTEFLRRAYRRPVREGEVGPLMKLYDQAAGQGESYVNAVRLLLKAVLVSPRFLYRIEEDRAPHGSSEPYRVSDHELACRLSYFLWSSMPDERLMELADQNRLSAPGPSSVPTKLGGKVIGIPSAPNKRDNSLEKVFDGELATFYEGPGPDGNWVGLDLHVPRRITQIRYANRQGEEDRMIGGKFQAANSADFSTGVVDLYTVAIRPAVGLLRQDVSAPDRFRYVRYLAPKNGYGNIAEMEIWGVADGAVLEQEVARMLDDPRAHALTDNFAASWLQIRKLSSARPSTEFFPEFQPDIRQAMYDETATFFDMLRQDDRSVLELLDADYTYVNEELANYYKLPGVKGRALQRVSLRPESHRGGLLGMGSILALTSHTSRTSPTLRGKWILEVILGAPPPPPPANAGMFKDEKDKSKEPKTFREKLALHASQAACASCHKKMDPLGFAMENFSAVGQWRDNDHGQPLDASGQLPSGEKLNGIGVLKQVLRNHQGEFVHNLAEQMLTYALGRELDYYDDAAVREIQAGMEHERYRFSALVGGIVRSYPFQYRRNSDTAARE